MDGAKVNTVDEDGWVEAVGDSLRAAGAELDHVVSVERDGSRLSVFAKPGLVQRWTPLPVAVMVAGTSAASTVAGLVLTIGGTTVGVCCCHYAAATADEQSRRTQTRNETTRQLMSELNAAVGSSNGELDLQAQCDHLLWLGDMGYEISDAEGSVEQAVVDAVPTQDFSQLQARDCLRAELKARRTLVGFTEAPLRYAPRLAHRSRPTAWSPRVLWCSKAAFRTWMSQRWLAPVVKPEWAHGATYTPLAATFQLHAAAPPPQAHEVVVLLRGLRASLDATFAGADPTASFAVRFVSEAFPPLTPPLRSAPL